MNDEKAFIDLFYDGGEIREKITNSKTKVAQALIDYRDFMQEQSSLQEKAIDDLAKLESWTDIEIKKITDPVYKKQISKLKDFTSDFNNQDTDIDEICHKFSYDIKCIVESKIPLWLSSLCFTLNHKWRQVIYQEIIKNYALIFSYIQYRKNDIENQFTNAEIGKRQECKTIVENEYVYLLEELKNKIG